MTATFDIETLYRDVMKLFHFCRTIKGAITRYPPMAGQNEAKISNVLCGPVIIPPAELQESRTLTELLCYLRDLNPASQKAFTVEQSMLLLSIQLAAMCESYRYTSTAGNILKYQNGYTDKLSLSGCRYLDTLEDVFEEQGIWQYFMAPRPAKPEEPEVKLRDEMCGLYGNSVVPPRKATWLADGTPMGPSFPAYRQPEVEDPGHPTI